MWFLDSNHELVQLVVDGVVVQQYNRILKDTHVQERFGRESIRLVLKRNSKLGYLERVTNIKDKQSLHLTENVKQPIINNHVGQMVFSIGLWALFGVRSPVHGDLGDQMDIIDTFKIPHFHVLTHIDVECKRIGVDVKCLEERLL
jgi:hypothetical protein